MSHILDRVDQIAAIALSHHEFERIRIDHEEFAGFQADREQLAVRTVMTAVRLGTYST